MPKSKKRKNNDLLSPLPAKVPRTSGKTSRNAIKKPKVTGRVFMIRSIEFQSEFDNQFSTSMLMTVVVDEKSRPRLVTRLSERPVSESLAGKICPKHRHVIPILFELSSKLFGNL